MFSPIPEVLEDLRKGKMIILVDDENRENEGDLYIAAEHCGADDINYMAKWGRGLICLTLTPEKCEQIQLPQMVEDNEAQYSTAFTVSIEAAADVTTGISARDRAITVQAAIAPDAKPTDIVRPGHIFPLRAKPGGVLQRAGQTEGSVDLSRLAGLDPSGVICEIMKDDGTMARLPDLEVFAEEHDMKICSIEDIIKYRRRTELLVERSVTTQMPTELGEFQVHVYETTIDNKVHLAFVRGDLTSVDAPLVRVHSECLTGDVFGSMRCDCGPQLHRALEMIAEEGVGCLLYMRQEGRGIGLHNKLKAYALQDEGLDTVEANEKLGFSADLREYGVGAQMLVDLGINKMRLMTNNPKKVVGLEAYDLDIVDRVPMELPSNPHNANYLKTKKEKLGHFISQAI